jgi:hypothetical protein
MRAIASARALAAAADSRLVVFWEINADLGTRYEELFVPDNQFEVRNIAPQSSRRDALIYLLYGELKRVKGIPAQWITRCFFRGNILRFVRPGDFRDDELERMVREKRRMLITSWWSFYGESELDFSIFSLHAPEQEEIDSVSRNFTENTVGIHIRRTDNANAIRYSPTEAFIGAMKNRVALDPDIKFFLTTDCRDTEKKIKSVFGERVITRNREVSRSSFQGMRDAVVDLFLLARTTDILGSYYSTFSETAASIGGIQWVTVTNDPSLVGHCNSEVLLVATGE